MNKEELSIYLLDVNARLEELDALEKQVKKAKDKLVDQARRRTEKIIESADTAEAKKDLLWAAYWNGGETINITTLFFAAGFRSSRKLFESGMLGPAFVQAKCACGKQFPLELARRGQLEAFRKGDYQRECPECAAIAQQKLRTEEAEKLAKSQAIAEIEEHHLQLLRTMPYRDYLQTREWATVRDAKLRRAHYRCELCHTKGTLNVHHKTYERRGCEELSDLIVLCGNCHAKFHDKLPK